MLYHVTFHMDRQSIVALGDGIKEVRAAEVERALSARKAGRLVGLWLLADGNGVIFILDADSHGAAHAELTTLPMFPHVRSITLLPLLPYPGLGLEIDVADDLKNSRETAVSTVIEDEKADGAADQVLTK